MPTGNNTVNVIITGRDTSNYNIGLNNAVLFRFKMD